jgi:hypothetical protein
MMVFTMPDAPCLMVLEGQEGHQQRSEGHQQKWQFSAISRGRPSNTLTTDFDGLTVFFFKEHHQKFYDARVRARGDPTQPRYGRTTGEDFLWPR